VYVSFGKNLDEMFLVVGSKLCVLNYLNIKFSVSIYNIHIGTFVDQRACKLEKRYGL